MAVGTEPIESEEPSDPLRDRLLDAAAQVFAEKGYSGTKIKDIVRVAGLSSGALYGRFESKEDLLTQAVIARSDRIVEVASRVEERVSDLVADMATSHGGPLSDMEAMHVELYVAARRVPEVAEAISQARERQAEALKPIVRRAKRDGSLPSGRDLDSLLFFFETVQLGLLLQRCAGVEPPEIGKWKTFVNQVLAGLLDEPS